MQYSRKAIRDTGRHLNRSSFSTNRGTKQVTRNGAEHHKRCQSKGDVFRRLVYLVKHKGAATAGAPTEMMIHRRDPESRQRQHPKQPRRALRAQLDSLVEQLEKYERCQSGRHPRQQSKADLVDTVADQPSQPRNRC